MKASELIAQLQEQMTAYGDREVFLFDQIAMLAEGENGHAPRVRCGEVVVCQPSYEARMDGAEGYFLLEWGKPAYTMADLYPTLTTYVSEQE